MEREHVIFWADKTGRCWGWEAKQWAGSQWIRRRTYGMELILLLWELLSLKCFKWQPTQYSCLENPMDRGAWRATVHRSQSWIRLKRLSMGHGDTQLEASSGHQKFRTGFPQRFPMNTWIYSWDFPGGSDSKESACNAGDLRSIPESGRSSREGNGNPFQDFCLENPMDRGVWHATVHGVRKSWKWLSN